MANENSEQPQVDLQKGEVVYLEELVSYNAGATVSRTLLDTATGTLTLFAFDAGQDLSEHSAPYDAAVQVLEGELEITVNGVVNDLEAGDFMIMPANAPHALHAVAKSKMLLTMIHG